MRPIISYAREPEAFLQYHFCQWLDDAGILYNASCAGMRTHIKIAAKMKMMGAKAGFPDLQIFNFNTKFRGLFIELKSRKGRAGDKQKEWRNALNSAGYLAVIMPSGLGFEKGMEWLKKLVCDYMNNRL